MCLRRGPLRTLASEIFTELLEMRQTISKNIVDPLLHRNNYNSLLFFIVLFFLPFSEVQFLTSFRICGANLWTQSAFVLLLGLDFFNFSFCSISSVFPADFIC